jgi:CBS domain-containing protein
MAPDGKSTLAGLSVKEAMRMEIVQLPLHAPIHKAIRQLIKYKIGALLVTDPSERPVGVVSKTDIVGAYYAMLPVESPLEHIMVGPPLFCQADDSLESALEIMKSAGVYRLYVVEGPANTVAGLLAYPDIAGLLYGFCSSCEQSLTNRRRAHGREEGTLRLRVAEVMTPSVVSIPEDSPLSEVMEVLSTYRFGALLAVDSEGAPSGVVSKTDLILAYLRGVSSEQPAKSVLASRNVVSCSQDQYVEDIIRQMVFSEVHRVFVHQGNPKSVTGVFSLSDAARARSGSCRACVTSRIKVEDAS